MLRKIRAEVEIRDSHTLEAMANALDTWVEDEDPKSSVHYSAWQPVITALRLEAARMKGEERRADKRFNPSTVRAPEDSK